MGKHSEGFQGRAAIMPFVDQGVAIRLPVERLVFAVAVALSCASETPEDVTDFENRALTLTEEAPAVAETPSPQALEVRWDGATGGSLVDSLSAVVENTTRSPIEAEVLLNVQAPDGDIAEQSLGLQLLAAGQTTRMAIPVNSLPLQSRVKLIRSPGRVLKHYAIWTSFLQASNASGV